MLKHCLSIPWSLQMVFSSSCTVYGNPSKVPIDESHPLAAVSPYGRTKLIIEEIFRDYSAADSQWRTILLRYFNPVGAHPSGPCPAPRGCDCDLQAFLTSLMPRCRNHDVQQAYIACRVE